MKKIVPVILFSIGLSINGFAQKEKKSCVSFKNLQTVIKNGAIIGEDYVPYYSGQIVTGIKQHKWFAGVGAGIDYQNNNRSVPVFAEAARYFKIKRFTTFVYTDLGYSISAFSKKQIINFIANENYRHSGGLYYEAGAGLRFGKTKKINWGPSVSYSCRQGKESGENYSYYSYFSYMPSVGNTDFATYKYSFKRYIVKLNFWF